MLSILQTESPVFLIKTDTPKAETLMGVPTKRDYYKLVQNEKGILEKYAQTPLPPLTAVIRAKFTNDYLAALKKYKEDNMDYLEVPEKMDFGFSKKDTSGFPIPTIAENLVYKHTGLNFAEQLDLLITEYWLLLADAVKLRMSETESGRKYLADAYRDMHHIRTLETNKL